MLAALADAAKAAGYGPRQFGGAFRFGTVLAERSVNLRGAPRRLLAITYYLMLDFLGKTVAKIFGSKSERDLKEITPYVALINAEYAKLAGLTDDQLRAQTDVRARPHCRAPGRPRRPDCRPAPAD